MLSFITDSCNHHVLERSFYWLLAVIEYSFVHEKVEKQKKEDKSNQQTITSEKLLQFVFG